MGIYLTTAPHYEPSYDSSYLEEIWIECRSVRESHLDDRNHSQVDSATLDPRADYAVDYSQILIH
jgi:hypothetical protein